MDSICGYITNIGIGVAYVVADEEALRVSSEIYGEIVRALQPKENQQNIHGDEECVVTAEMSSRMRSENIAMKGLGT